MRWRDRWIAALVGLLLVAADEAATESAHAAASAAGDALEIEVRKEALRLLEADAEAKLAELARLRAELEAQLAPATEEVERDLKTLIQFYQAMKPKNAATLLERLPAGLAADVLGAMKSRQAGKILDAMEPARAVRISRLMAGEKR
jgi:flagellar motility protein MotE (MotC chaperone)